MLGHEGSTSTGATARLLQATLQRGILYRYRNHDNSLLVSDNDVARDHGDFSTSYRYLNFYVWTIEAWVSMHCLRDNPCIKE